MALRSVETTTPAETEALGGELAGLLGDGAVVLLRGDLGAGKTTFVRGAARALGIQEPITSPTFSLAHRYRGDHLTVSHLDLYRIEGLEGEEPELLEEYLEQGGIAFVEWPQEGAPELSGASLQVTLSHAGGDRRRIVIEELLHSLQGGGAR